MTRFAAFPIRWKVTIVGMLASVTVLVVACATFFQYGIVQARNDLGRSLRMRAEVLGNVSSAALLFDDEKSALEILSALHADPRITAAALYGPDRRRFVSYQSAGDDVFAELEALLPEGTRWTTEQLLMAHPIDFKGSRIGFIVLASDLTYLHDVVRRSIGVAALVLALCLALGWLLSSQLQRVVTRPIFTLAELARTISRDGNYSLRVPVQGADELAMLGASFNEMLQQIERRDAELEASRDVLERRVDERTRELQLEIAERRQAQASLVRQTEELTRSNADLEQFAYVASHDLQEPLRMVASYTQLLAETTRDRLGKDAQDYIDYAVDGALRMQNLISDLLAYSRLSRAELRFVPLAAEDIVNQAIKNLQMAIAESGARVVAEGLPRVHGSASQLTQLFQNLIANAVKFRGERTPEIRISAVPGKGVTEFTVRDNGIGFDPKYAPKVFVIFHRLHARGKYPGTGIGLAVCKKIVEHHGGKIWVDSTPGEGTTFHFTITDQQPDGSPSPTREDVHDARQA